jgi:hypothetical protein
VYRVVRIVVRRLVRMCIGLLGCVSDCEDSCQTIG